MIRITMQSMGADSVSETVCLALKSPLEIECVSAGFVPGVPAQACNTP